MNDTLARRLAIADRVVKLLFLAAAVFLLGHALRSCDDDGGYGSRQPVFAAECAQQHMAKDRAACARRLAPMQAKGETR